MVRRLLPTLLLTGCLGPPDPSVDGAYAHGAFHLMVECPDSSVRVLDYLYPSGAAFEFRELEGEAISVRWGSRALGEGAHESGGTIEMNFTQRDPFTPEVSWTFLGRIRDDFRFHEKTIVGNIRSGDAETAGMTCAILPRSVAWFTTKPRLLDARTFAPHLDGRVHGDWARFVWFLDAGPYAMFRKGDPGQRGENLRLFSFAATGGGPITTGSQAAFFENGFGTWQGAASSGSAVFPQHEPAWHLDFSQDVIWDDGESGPGIRRVLAGFVTGTYRVNASDYPPGWEGDTGLLPLVSPGFAYWLDFDRGEQVTQEAVVRSGDLLWLP